MSKSVTQEISRQNRVFLFERQTVRVMAVVRAGRRQSIPSSSMES